MSETTLEPVDQNFIATHDSENNAYFQGFEFLTDEEFQDAVEEETLNPAAIYLTPGIEPQPIKLGEITVGANLNGSLAVLSGKVENFKTVSIVAVGNGSGYGGAVSIDGFILKEHLMNGAAISIPFAPDGKCIRVKISTRTDGSNADYAQVVEGIFTGGYKVYIYGISKQKIVDISSLINPSNPKQ